MPSGYTLNKVSRACSKNASLVKLNGGTVMKRIALAAAATLASLMVTTSANADNHNRRVLVVNDTRHTLLRVYGSNVGTDQWEEDVLGSSTLDPGERVTVNFDDGTEYCNYDLKAVFDDGDEVIRRRFNVCTQSQWVIHE